MRVKVAVIVHFSPGEDEEIVGLAHGKSLEENKGGIDVDRLRDSATMRSLAGNGLE